MSAVKKYFKIIFSCRASDASGAVALRAPITPAAALFFKFARCAARVGRGFLFRVVTARWRQVAATLVILNAITVRLAGRTPATVKAFGRWQRKLNRPPAAGCYFSKLSFALARPAQRPNAAGHGNVADFGLDVLASLRRASRRLYFAVSREPDCELGETT